MKQHTNYKSGGFLQASPCFMFIVSYIFLCLFFLYNYSLDFQNILLDLPLFVTLVTILYAFFSFKKNVSHAEKIRVFFSGLIHQSASYFYATFIGTLIFMHILSKIGAISTLSATMIIILPASYLLPCYFLMGTFLGYSIRSWTVAMIIYLPIICSVAYTLQLNIALVVATALTGIIFGYQNSMIFGYQMHDEKKRIVIWLLFPPAVCTVLVLSMFYYPVMPDMLYAMLLSSLNVGSYVACIPMFLFFMIALIGFDLVMNVAIVSILAIIVGYAQGKFSPVDLIALPFEGYYQQPNMVKFMMLCIFLSGLINIINFNYGFHYMVNMMRHKMQSSYIRRLSVFMIITIINVSIAFDFLSTNVLMPMMKKISDRYNIGYQQSLGLLSVLVTIQQCFLPYAPLMLLASYLSHTSILKIISYMIYPCFVLIWMILYIFLNFGHIEIKKRFYYS